MEEVNHSKETESVFAGTIVISLIIGLFLGMLLDGGLISGPAIWFYNPIAGYLFIRLMGWKILKRVPRLTRMQKNATYLLPLYGFVIFFVISSLIRNLRQ